MKLAQLQKPQPDFPYKPYRPREERNTLQMLFDNPIVQTYNKETVGDKIIKIAKPNVSE